MPQEWFIEAGGRIDGPVSSKDLSTRASSGKLRPTDRVSPDREKWVPASRIKGLQFPAGTPLPEAPDDEPAETIVHENAEMGIPGYEIQSILGSGGCGVVYRAKQIKLERIVALKTVNVAAAASPKMMARFEQEAVSLAKLQHPNIVNIFDSGREGGRVFFAMELLQGEDLADRVKKAGKLDERTAWAVARQTAAALAHAADLGIYHRDIKPHNLFLVPMPTGFGLPADLPLVKVTDFGLALTKRAAEGETDERLTAAGTVLGTPAYMAPEQFKSPDIDHRADIYSLGATVYHALNGRPPFGGQSVWDVMVSKIEGKYPPLGKHVSAETVELIEAMMAPELADRVPSYAELIQRIDALPTMQGVAGSVAVPMRSRASKPRKPRPKWLLPAALGGLVAAVAIGVGALAFGGKSTTPPAKYVPFGNEDALFNKEGLNGWVSMPGKAIELDDDDERERVLLIDGAKRPYTPYPDLRVTVGLDLFKAKAAFVSFAVPEKMPPGPRLAIRVSREEGVSFGTLSADGGTFTPTGTTLPYPTSAELAGKRPYLSVTYERIDNRWLGEFNGKLLGSLDDDGTRKLDEFRIASEGGPVRVDSAVLQRLQTESPSN